MPAAYLRSAQLEVKAARTGDVEVHFGHDIAPQGFAWVVPVQRGDDCYARVGLMCESDAGTHFRRFAHHVTGSWGLRMPVDADGRIAPRQKILPLAPIERTYTDRVVAVGDAAGLVKATTGGGIYYSLVSASIAADVLIDGLSRGTLHAGFLSRYQKRWQQRLGAELQAQLTLRELAERMDDEEIDGLFDLAQTNGVMPIVRRTARFNQHRNLIVSLLKHPPARRLLFKELGSRAVTAAFG
jgi:flavin-dependent dehydrogenase